MSKSYTEEELALNKLEKERKIYDKQWRIAMDKPSYEEMQDHLEIYQARLSSASRDYRVLKTPIMTKIEDEIGDRMSLKHFISCCKSGGFIDYDGYGTYVKNDEKSDINIYPSDVAKNRIRTDFEEILWYNR